MLQYYTELKHLHHYSTTTHSINLVLIFTKFIEPLGTRNNYMIKQIRFKNNLLRGSKSKSIKSGWVCAR